MSLSKHKKISKIKKNCLTDRPVGYYLSTCYKAMKSQIKHLASAKLAANPMLNNFGYYYFYFYKSYISA